MKPEIHKPIGPSMQYIGSNIPFVERPTCTIAEACSAVGFGKTKLYELIDGGAVESMRIGRRRLIRVPSLLRFLNAV